MITYIKERFFPPSKDPLLEKRYKCEHCGYDYSIAHIVQEHEKICGCTHEDSYLYIDAFHTQIYITKACKHCDTTKEEYEILEMIDEDDELLQTLLDKGRTYYKDNNIT